MSGQWIAMLAGAGWALAAVALTKLARLWFARARREALITRTIAANRAKRAGNRQQRRADRAQARRQAKGKPA